MSAETYELHNSSVDVHKDKESYVSVGDIFELHKYHFPRNFREFVPPYPRPQGPDSCRVIFRDDINHFRFSKSEQWANYPDIEEAFERHQIRTRNKPYKWEHISAPVKVVISYRAHPIKAVLTYERVFPQYGILALLRPHQSLGMAYVAVAVLNSALGIASYNQLSMSSDLSTKHLSEISIAHKDATEDEIDRVADLSYQISTLYEAELKTDRILDREEAQLAQKLHVAVCTLLKLDEGQPEKLIESILSFKPWGIQKDQLNFSDTSQELLYSPAKIRLLSAQERKRLTELRKRVNGDQISDKDKSDLTELGKLIIYEDRINAGPPSEFRVTSISEETNGNGSNKKILQKELSTNRTKRIFSIPGVCGGKPCIAGTRIPIWMLEQTRRFGTTEAEMLESYPSLSAGDLVAAWAYVDAHQSEIERQIMRNEEA